MEIGKRDVKLRLTDELMKEPVSRKIPAVIFAENRKRIWDFAG